MGSDRAAKTEAATSFPDTYISIICSVLVQRLLPTSLSDQYEQRVGVGKLSNKNGFWSVTV